MKKITQLILVLITLYVFPSLSFAEEFVSTQINLTHHFIGYLAEQP